MKERTSQALFTYWNEVRGPRLAPRRFEIEPSRITAILPETFILEQQGRRNYVFRLAGTRVCEQFGREFRNTDMLGLWTPDDQEVVIRMLDSCTRDGAVGVVTFEATATPRRTINFEMVLLPLIHNGSEITRVLGAMATSQTAPWIGLDPLTSLRVTGFNVIWPDGRPHAVVSRGDQPPPFAVVHGFSHTVRSRDRQFRVYDGGLSVVENNDN
jgi:hypothetical protein